MHISTIKFIIILLTSPLFCSSVISSLYMNLILLLTCCLLIPEVTKHHCLHGDLCHNNPIVDVNLLDPFSEWIISYEETLHLSPSRSFYLPCMLHTAKTSWLFQPQICYPGCRQTGETGYERFALVLKTDYKRQLPSSSYNHNTLTTL